MSAAKDLAYGFRQMRRSPAASITAILSMALGIGAATAIFSVVHGVVLNPFPYKDVGTLMSVRVTEPGVPFGRTGYTVDQFLEIRDRNTIFSGVTGSTISDVFWTGREVPERLRGNHTTYDGLEIMGVPALVGRTFTRADAGSDVCVLGFRFWQRQFAGDFNAIGQTMLLNGRVRTILGVMPPRFMWRGADVYIPLDLQRGTIQEGVEFLHLTGRLKPGVTHAQAEADLKPIFDEFARADPQRFPQGYRVGLLSFADTFPSGITDVLWALFGAVGLLLAIACANVSNLMLAQSLDRAREMAVRAALGASPARLLRQVLTEGLWVAILGGALGVLFAWVGLKGILALVPPFTIPDEADVRLNLPVLAFAVLVSVVTALLAALVPAIRAGRRDVVEPIKDSSRSSRGRGKSLLAGGLVVSEVAFSLVLLVGATLTIRSLLAVTTREYGVDTQNVLIVRTPLDPARYSQSERRILFAERLAEAVQAIPAVEYAAVTYGVHPFGSGMMPVEAPGVDDTRPAMVHHVGADYISVFRIPLRQGRLLTEDDVRARRQYALVGETFAKRYFSGRSALGAQFRLPRLRNEPFQIAETAFEIIGVVGDTTRAFGNEHFPDVYIPHSLSGMANFGLVVRPKSGDALSLLPTLRETVASIDRDQPLVEPQLIDSMIARFVTAGPKFSVVLFGVFASIGLTLAAVGIYGVIAKSVASRTQEIGIRMALGASVRDVVAMVVKQGARLVVLGLIVGLFASAAAVRALRSFLAGVSEYDPAAVVAALAIVLLAGLLASCIPARRAASVSPVQALKN
jgi:predicted permease